MPRKIIWNWTKLLYSVEKFTNENAKKKNLKTNITNKFMNEMKNIKENYCENLINIYYEHITNLIIL